MASYYVMECRGKSPIARVSLVSDVRDAPWMSGSVVTAPNGAVKYSVDEKRTGNIKALYELDVPLIRDDLLNAIRDAGVDNLECFPVIVYDAKVKSEHSNFHAFNILGIVSAADIGKSKLMHRETLAGLDNDFESLVLDENRIPSILLLFRLAESVNAIVVRKKVKKLIENRNIEGMMFYEPEEWSG